MVKVDAKNVHKKDLGRMAQGLSIVFPGKCGHLIPDEYALLLYKWMFKICLEKVKKLAFKKK